MKWNEEEEKKNFRNKSELLKIKEIYNIWP